MSLALPGFTAYNWKKESHQEIIALIEGDPARIDAFRRRLKSESQSRPISHQ